MITFDWDSDHDGRRLPAIKALRRKLLRSGKRQEVELIARLSLLERVKERVCSESVARTTAVLRGCDPKGEESQTFGVLSVTMPISWVCNSSVILNNEEIGFETQCDPLIKFVQFCEMIESHGGWVICQTDVIPNPSEARVTSVECVVVIDQNNRAGKFVIRTAQNFENWTKLHNHWSDNRFDGGVCGNARSRKFARNNPRPLPPTVPTLGDIAYVCQFEEVPDTYQLGTRVAEGLTLARKAWNAQ